MADLPTNFPPPPKPPPASEPFGTPAWRKFYDDQYAWLDRLRKALMEA